MANQQQPEPQESNPQTTETQGAGSEARPSQKRLYRSRQQRMLLGVAGGLADYFDVDPTLVRIAFVLLTLVGGSGLLLYAVLAIIMPSEETLDVHPREAARATVDEAVEESKHAVDRASFWVKEKTGRPSSTDEDHDPSQPPRS